MTSYVWGDISWLDTQFIVEKGMTKVLLLVDMSYDVYNEGFSDHGFMTNLSKYSIIIDGVIVVDKKNLHYIESETITINNIEYTIQYTSKDVSSF